MSNSLPFFRPYQGKGSAFIFNQSDNGIFVSSMPENADKPKSFNSEARINFKLGQSDIGELLATLSGRQAGTGKVKDGHYSGLYHEGDSHSSVFTVQENDKGGYSLGLSRKADGVAVRHGINISTGEAQLLLEFLRLCVPQLVKSDFVPKQQNSEPVVQKPASKPADKKQVVAAKHDDTPF